MSDYDSDILEWSEHQAALLKRRAAGEFVNESDLEWLVARGHQQHSGTLTN